MLTKAQKTEALAILERTYPNAKPALEFHTPFELLMATILSAESTDVMVDLWTRELFPVANTPEQIAAMTEEELFPYIKRCGFFNTKGRHILETARILVTKYGGEVLRIWNCCKPCPAWVERPPTLWQATPSASPPSR
jgi:endonuclease-3